MILDVSSQLRMCRFVLRANYFFDVWYNVIQLYLRRTTLISTCGGLLCCRKFLPLSTLLPVMLDDHIVSDYAGLHNVTERCTVPVFCRGYNDVKSALKDSEVALDIFSIRFLSHGKEWLLFAMRFTICNGKYRPPGIGAIRQEISANTAFDSMWIRLLGLFL